MGDSLLDCLISAATDEIANLNSSKNDSAKALIKGKSTVHSGDTDSSEDEDNRDFENRTYNQCGREVKHLLSNSEFNKSTEQVKTKTSWKIKSDASSKSEFIFNIRVVNPLVSFSMLESRINGREVIPLKRLKMFVKNIPADKDWIVAGVIVNKCTRVSQKGKNYCIWTVSDLKIDLNTVSVYLFGSAYKQLWKTVAGTVVGILNPSVFDGQENSKTQANLSINNHQLVMVIGQSKDLGTCKSMKKNGEPCTAFVNLSVCEYCLYHVKQEYNKCSKRSDLQSSFAGQGLTALRNKVLGKDQVFYAGKLYSAIPTNKRKQDWLSPQPNKQSIKDKELLNSLTGVLPCQKQPTKMNKLKQAAQLEIGAGQRQKDLARLQHLGGSTTLNCNLATATENNCVIEKQLNLDKKETKSLPFLKDFTKSKIDLNAPIQRKEIIRAKQNALTWVHKNGSIKKKDPNNIRGTGKASKRLRETTDDCIIDPKKPKIQENEFFSDRFKKMMAVTSKHNDLLELREDEEQEKYFKKLEMKERMEEKMLSTYKVPCKAVKCLKCKYTNFSASDLCKAEKHPLKVFDAIKRFFKCSNCNNRTACLTVIPIDACKNCGSNNWERTAMMKEKKVDIVAPRLSIRGGEQKFVNSVITDTNLDLLVADD